MRQRDASKSGPLSAKVATILLICVAAAGLLTMLSFWQYQGIFSSSVHDISNIYLEEISQREVTHLQTNLDAQFSDLELVIAELSRQPEWSMEELQAFLSDIQKSYDFQFLAFVDENAYYCTSTEYKPAASKINCLDQLLGAREPIISVNESLAAEDVVLLGLPFPAVKAGDQSFVALVAGLGTDSFIQKMALKGSNSQTRTSLLNRDGVFIVYTGPDEDSPMGTNLFSALERYAVMETDHAVSQLRSNISGGQSGSCLYVLDGVQTLMYYAPVPDTEWYVVSEMPYDVVGAIVQRITSLIVLSGVLVGFVICTLLTVFLLSLSRAQAEKLRAEAIGGELKETDCAKKQAEEALRILAYYDELTGIANKNLFLKEAEELLRGARPYAYVVLDIRKFKVVNDLFGFARGDSLLRHMADVLKSSVSSQELCARFASDEFHLLLLYPGKDNLEARLHDIVARICDYSFSDSTDFRVSLSGGVYLPEDAAVPVEQMGDLSKLALQKVKAHHGSQIHFYNEEIRNSILAEQEIEMEMQRGIDENEFVIYLQPKYNAQTQRLAGAEALVRWQHPVRGLLAPDRFIPVLEKNGFITKLDLCVLEQVCALLSRWQAEGRLLVPISVNQSRLLLHSEGYTRQLTDLLQRYHVPHELIEVEVTESVFLEDKQRMVTLINELHQLGCSISMDDFGSGYSTLNMLKEIMVDVLKIDKDFFSESANTERGRKIVSSIISMARELEIQVVAEGVETLDQSEFLRKNGCDLLQGYYYSKPVPCAIFEEVQMKNADGDMQRQ